MSASLRLVRDPVLHDSSRPGKTIADVFTIYVDTTKNETLFDKITTGKVKLSQ